MFTLREIGRKQTIGSGRSVGRCRDHALRVFVLAVWLSSSSGSNIEPDRSETSSADPALGETTGIVARPAGSTDSLFLEMEKDVPGGFGGLFFDRTGMLNVYLLEKGQAERARTALAPFLRSRAKLRGDTSPAASDPSAIKILQGKYSFSRLAWWMLQLMPALDFEGVLSMDNDERRNRLAVGVKDRAALTAVERVVEELGIPMDAVIVEVTEPIRPQSHVLNQQLLNDEFRPVLGGIQIRADLTRSGVGACTLGFVVEIDGVRGFLTNSHCDGQFGTVRGTAYYQPDPTLPWITNGTIIGYELIDPPLFTGAGHCPVIGGTGTCPRGDICRYSDAVFIQLDTDGTDGTMGRIARTVPNPPVSPYTPLTIDDAHPPFRVLWPHAISIVGETRHKIGARTGWTTGEITQTCVFLPTLEEYNLLCQDEVAPSLSEHGDSGSPVFAWNGGRDVHLAGLLWGGNASFSVFSPMANIECDFRVNKYGPGTMKVLNPADSGFTIP